MSNAFLTQTDLSDADMAGCVLLHADLSGATLAGCNLEGADFRDAVLDDCNLDGAILFHANLSRASLSGMSLLGALLDDADFSACDLSNVRMVRRLDIQSAERQRYAACAPAMDQFPRHRRSARRPVRDGPDRDRSGFGQSQCGTPVIRRAAEGQLEADLSGRS